MDFEQLWDMYPRRLGKKAARKHYLTALKTHTHQEIKQAMINYIQYLETNKVEEKYTQHGSTWFNNWEDWKQKKKTITII